MIIPVLQQDTKQTFFKEGQPRVHKSSLIGIKKQKKITETTCVYVENTLSYCKYVT